MDLYQISSFFRLPAKDNRLILKYSSPHSISVNLYMGEFQNESPCYMKYIIVLFNLPHKNICVCVLLFLLLKTFKCFYHH